MTTVTCPNCKTPNQSTSKYCSNCGNELPLRISPTSQGNSLNSGLEPGTTLQGRYRIVNELGRGGFGAVYTAWDTSLSRPCAIKENLEPTEEAQRQFSREARILASLSHPNLPRVTDHFIIQDQGQYLVMDYIEGIDLEVLVKQSGPVQPSQATTWIAQIADALQYLHNHKPPIIHRDVKPANIRLTPDGNVYLVDFGLVKHSDPHQQTTVGARAITPGFSPPEQYGAGVTDERSDIYALAATLYSLITGTAPPESVQRVSQDTLIAANQINAKVNPAIGLAINRAMSLQPSQRYQTVSAFKAALSGQAPAIPVQPPPKTEPSRRMWWIIAIILIILSVCIFSVSFLWPRYGEKILAMLFPTDPPTPTATTTLELTGVSVTPTYTSEVTHSSETPPSITPTDTPSPPPMETSTDTPTATISPSITPSFTPTSPPPPLSDYDLVFASDRSGDFSVVLMNTNDWNDWKHLSLPSGTYRAWWPSFCGNQIAVEAYRGSDPQWTYLINPIDGSSYQFDPSDSAQALGVPRCSPDGNTIANTTKQSGNWSNLIIDNFPNSGADPIYYENSWGYSSWTYDNTQIYTMNRENNQWVIYRTQNPLSGSGTRTRVLTDSKYPAISPNGENLVYVCNNLRDLCLLNLPSNNEIVLADLTYKEVEGISLPASAMWSRDGEWIYYASAEDGDWDIYRIQANGTNKQNLTESWDTNELMPALKW